MTFFTQTIRLMAILLAGMVMLSAAENAPTSANAAEDAHADEQEDNAASHPTLAPEIKESALGHNKPDIPTSAELAETGPQFFEEPSERADRYIRAARIAAKSRDFERAEQLYTRPIELSVPEELKKTALLELAAMYEASLMFTKMAVVLEKFVKQWPKDPRVPHIYMRLGHVYRDLGSYNVAISRFYQVLKVSLNIPEDRLSDYQRLSLRAQYDIAETYFILGDYDKAQRFYERLTLLDLPKADQEHVLFKSAYIAHLNGEYAQAVNALQHFVDEHPGSRLLAEARFLLSNAHRELKQHPQALRVALELLRSQQKATGSDLEEWRYWQRKTANLVANDFYERGDYHGALQIYQAMARLSDDPAWQMPVIYQMGLCFERMRLMPRAREAYRILAVAEEWDATVVENERSLASIQDMAKWRLEHMEWTDTMSTDLLELQRNMHRNVPYPRINPHELPDEEKPETDPAEPPPVDPLKDITAPVGTPVARQGT